MIEMMFIFWWEKKNFELIRVSSSRTSSSNVQGDVSLLIGPKKRQRIRSSFFSCVEHRSAERLFLFSSSDCVYMIMLVDIRNPTVCSMFYSSVGILQSNARLLFQIKTQQDRLSKVFFLFSLFLLGFFLFVRVNDMMSIFDLNSSSDYFFSLANQWQTKERRSTMMINRNIFIDLYRPILLNVFVRKTMIIFTNLNEVHRPANRTSR